MLVPIKPVSCACQSAKFKDWRADREAYEVTPIRGNVYNVTVTLTDYNMTLTVDSQTVTTTDFTINDANSDFINLTFVNHSSNRAFFRFYEILKDGGIIDLYSISVSAGDSIGNLVGINQSHDVTQYNVIAGSRSMHYNDNRKKKGDFELSDIITSDLVTETEDEFLNTYYANWCIVDPFDDFENELKIAFMMAEDKLKTYKSQMEDFTPSAKTVMSVAYGQRDTTSDDYEYPINAGLNTQPNRTQKGKQNAVTDTTTVDKNEEPFKNLDKTKAMDGWLKFFVDQFKDCFTLCEAMTW